MNHAMAALVALAVLQVALGDYKNILIFFLQ
jgi:uncharacterized membrane protein